MADITSVNLRDLVPDSIRDDPDVSAAIDAIDGELKKVSQLSSAPAIFARIDELDSDTLDHLAWQFDSKVWRDTWPLNLKRSVIKTVIVEKAKKGTRRSVVEALQSLGSNSIITEWFQRDPQGQAHTFSITINVNEIEGQVSQDTQADVIRRLEDVKPVRSLYTLSLATQAEAGLGFQAEARPAVYKRILADEAPYMGGVGFQGASRPVIYTRLNTTEVV